jgi:NADPH:quinone reductase-like Zn-dependent oxidoreductase
MRSYHVNSGAGLDGLRLGASDVRQPGPGEVLVEVRAAALSYRDAMILRGEYVLPVRPDVIPLAEGVGVVTATGPGVTAPRVGTRVVAAVFPRWQDGPFTLDVADQLGGSLDGLLAEQVILPADALVEVPDVLTDAQAATVPCTGVTAWNALTGGRPVRPGETVLTLGTGGVSLYAVQLAAAMGARVIATTGDDAKAGLLKQLGAETVLNRHTTPDWPATVRELTGGRGVDHIVEVAGTLEASLAAVALGGQIAVVGFVGGRDSARVDPYTIFTAGAVLRPLAVGSRAQLAELMGAIAALRLQPVVDRTFPFDRAAQAFHHYLDGAALGRVVITTS